MGCFTQKVSRYRRLMATEKRCFCWRWTFLFYFGLMTEAILTLQTMSHRFDGTNIVTTAQTQETQNLLRLFRLISIRAASEAEYSYWKQTMSQVIHGMSFEDSVYRDGRTPAYIECIEYGIGTSLIPNVLSTSALVYRVSRVERQKDLLLASLERCFSIQQRLINDIKSVEKEMLEGAQGKCTNAFLLLANRLGFEQANNFMQDEIVGISRVISALTSRLGHTDPFVKLIRHASIKIDAWYESNPQRCKP